MAKKNYTISGHVVIDGTRVAFDLPYSAIIKPRKDQAKAEVKRFYNLTGRPKIVIKNIELIK